MQLQLEILDATVTELLPTQQSVPYDALPSTLDPIKNLFTIRNLDFVIKRLAVLAGYEDEIVHKANCSIGEVI
jgi:hypothetical protein